MPNRVVPLHIRFWAKVNRKVPNECWLWKAGITGRGYGYIRPGGLAPQVLAHRLSYEMHFGPVPDGLHVLHRCDVPGCVNPKHLFVGTNADNMADRDAKGRGTKPPRHIGEKHPRAKLNKRQVEEIRSSKLSPKEISERYGISRSQASAIKNGDSWK